MKQSTAQVKAEVAGVKDSLSAWSSRNRDDSADVSALSVGAKLSGRVAGQQVQVLPRGGTGLGEVGAGLLDGQAAGSPAPRTARRRRPPPADGPD